MNESQPVRLTFRRQGPAAREGSITLQARHVPAVLALTGASRRVRRDMVEWLERWYCTKPYCCGWSGPYGWSWVELSRPDQA